MARPVIGKADTPRNVRLYHSHPVLAGPPEARPSNAMTIPPRPPHQSFDSPYLEDYHAVERLVSRELEQWRNDLQPFYDKANASWARWMLEPVPDDDPFISKVQSAYPLYAVEQILPRILGTNPGMDYSPLDVDRDSLICTILGKVVSAQMKRMGFEYAARDFVKQALVCGFSVAKLFWVRETAVRDVPVTEEHAFPGAENIDATYRVTVKQPTRVVVCNEPRFEIVNVAGRDFVWPPYAKSISQAPAVWQRVWMRMADLRDLGARGVYQNVDLVNPNDSMQWSTEYQAQFTPQGIHVTPPDTRSSDPDDANALVELWERWEDDRITVIANRRVCIRDEASPFNHKRKPFVDYTPMPRPFQLQGISIIDTIIEQNDELGTLMRQMSDAVHYAIMPAFKSQGGVDWGNFILQPGAHLDMEDVQDVEPLVLPQVDMAAGLQWRQSHLDDMQRNSGVFDVETLRLGGTHTATGVSQVIQQATMRLTEFINVLSYRSMRPFGKMMEELNAQYLDEGILVDFSNDPVAQQAWRTFVQDVAPLRILGVHDASPLDDMPDHGLVRVTPEMIRAEGRIEPIPEVGQDKQTQELQKRSDATQLAQALAPIMASPQNPVNLAELARYIAHNFDVPPDVQRQLVQTPPVQQMAAVTAALPSGAASGPSGPSGDNLPTGNVVGAAGAAGPIGTAGLGQP